MQRALLRVIRILLSYGFVFGTKSFTEFMLMFELPEVIIPVGVSFLSGLAKLLREKDIVDLPF